jgi:uncharacterized protein (TIGR02147 family)
MKPEYYHQTLLKNELAKKIAQNPRYSIRAFAKRLGLDPTALSKLLNGSKKLTPGLADKISNRLELSPNEREDILASMVLAYKEGGTKRFSPRVKQLDKKKPKPQPVLDLTPDIFRTISDWYHYAILQLIEQKDFINDPSWIASQLNISGLEASLAVQRLLRLGIVAEKDERLVRIAPNLTTGDPTLTSSAHKKRIKQVTQKSLESLENDAIKIRNHSTMTMSIDPELLPMAKVMIDEFMDTLAAKLQTKKEHVYELQINLFPLQRTTK